MNVVIRLIERMRQKNVDRFIVNYTFVNKSNVLLKVYPIPEWVQGNCGCGKPATFMDSSMHLLCKKCLNNAIGESKMLQEQGLIFPSVEKSIRASIFEWSPNTENWYRVSGKRIEADSRQRISDEEKKERLFEIMQAVLMGQPQSVEADYYKEEKKLVIFV